MVRLALPLVSIGMANALSPCALVDQIKMSNLATMGWWQLMLTWWAATNHVPKLRCPWAPRRVGSFSVLCTLCVTPFSILTVSGKAWRSRSELHLRRWMDDSWNYRYSSLSSRHWPNFKSVDFFVQMSVVELLKFYLCPSTSATLVHDVCPWCGIWCSTGTCSQYSCISDDECVALAVELMETFWTFIGASAILRVGPTLDPCASRKTWRIWTS